MITSVQEKIASTVNDKEFHILLYTNINGAI